MKLMQVVQNVNKFVYMMIYSLLLLSKLAEPFVFTIVFKKVLVLAARCNFSHYVNLQNFHACQKSSFFFPRFLVGVN